MLIKKENLTDLKFFSMVVWCLCYSYSPLSVVKQIIMLK